MAQKIIALDAGHGMSTPGKRCLKRLDPNETREWFLNDRIMDKVEAALAAYDCTVLRVDDTTGAKDISLSARVKAANDAKADMYISIHHNAGINGGTGGGTVVFYCSSKTERQLQAQALYNAVVAQTGLTGNRSEKVKYYGFYVIKNTAMPAFLLENGFMDSATDTPIILTAAHAEKTAQGILNFLRAELSLYKKGQEGQTSGEPVTNQESTTLTYEVQKGDTLIKIGSEFGVAWGQIAVANDLIAPYTVYIGQQLRIPASTTTAEPCYYPAYKDKATTLAAALTSLGITSTYAYRKQIAVANGISGYIGTAAQNTQMYNLLVAGLLKRA